MLLSVQSFALVEMGARNMNYAQHGCHILAMFCHLHLCMRRILSFLSSYILARVLCSLLGLCLLYHALSQSTRLPHALVQTRKHAAVPQSPLREQKPGGGGLIAYDIYHLSLEELVFPIAHIIDAISSKASRPACSFRSNK